MITSDNDRPASINSQSTSVNGQKTRSDEHSDSWRRLLDSSRTHVGILEDRGTYIVRGVMDTLTCLTVYLNPTSCATMDPLVRSQCIEILEMVFSGPKPTISTFADWNYNDPYPFSIVLGRIKSYCLAHGLSDTSTIASNSAALPVPSAMTD